MGEKVLSVKNLTVCLKKGGAKILDDVSFDLFENDVLALDGLNGSGKSTLLKVVFGETADYVIKSGEVIFHPFSEGNVLEFGTKELLAYRSSIGYVPQKDLYASINRINVGDLIEDAASHSNMPKNEAFALFDKCFQGNPKITLKSRPCKMSGGEQRMISIFLGAVCRKATKLFIIDEPLNNLDFENAMRISDLLNEIHRSNEKAAMLLVTHCKIITCVNRQRKLAKGRIEKTDSNYECQHCMGEPDCDLFYCKTGL